MGRAKGQVNLLRLSAYYHVTAQTRRSQIEKKGLLADAPKREWRLQEPGVYVYQSLDDARDHAQDTGDPMDIWAVSDGQFIVDPMGHGRPFHGMQGLSFVSYQDIPRANICLLESHQPKEGWTP